MWWWFLIVGFDISSRSMIGWSSLLDTQPAQHMLDFKDFAAANLTWNIIPMRTYHLERLTTWMWTVSVDSGHLVARVLACKKSFQWVPQQMKAIVSFLFRGDFKHLSLAIVFLLKGRFADFVSWWGIKCSSWTQVNVGTSSRSPCASLGDLLQISVLEANRMLERTWVDRMLGLNDMWN